MHRGRFHCVFLVARIHFVIAFKINHFPIVFFFSFQRDFYFLNGYSFLSNNAHCLQGAGKLRMVSPEDSDLLDLLGQWV
jgi:hypothetical protein